jgi:hypothetical protein
MISSMSQCLAWTEIDGGAARPALLSFKALFVVEELWPLAAYVPGASPARRISLPVQLAKQRGRCWRCADAATGSLQYCGGLIPRTSQKSIANLSQAIANLRHIRMKTTEKLTKVRAFIDAVKFGWGTRIRT